MFGLMKGDPVIVQGITGAYGSLHTKLMLEYGTNIAAGVVPGRGSREVHGVRVYDTVKDAVAASGAKVSVVFVPASNFLSAGLEALKAGIRLLVAVTEHVPVRDTLKLLNVAGELGARIIGPNTPGLITPGVAKLGIMPASSFRPGHVAVFSRSGTLMYEVSHRLSNRGMGQSLAVGIGGDPVNCTTLIECLEEVRGNPGTKSVVVVGEIGGDAEERLAKHIVETRFSMPVVAYIAGRHAPKEKRMGHAGAIIYGSYGTAESKMKSFQGAGVPVANSPSEIPELLLAIGKG